MRKGSSAGRGARPVCMQQPQAPLSAVAHLHALVIGKRCIPEWVVLGGGWSRQQHSAQQEGGS